MTANQELIDQVDFGMEVEAFLGSRIGKHLAERAESEAQEATEALKKVAPEDAAAVRALQTTIQRAESIGYWMAEIIQSGINAQEQLLELDK